MREIPGYEGLYAATEEGRIISLKATKSRRKRTLKPYQSTGGYLKVNLYSADGRACHKYVHRLIAAAYLPNDKGLREVDHINGNRQDNRPENLRWCTRQENIHYALSAGRWSKAVQVQATNTNTGEVRHYAFLNLASADLFGRKDKLNYYKKRYGARFVVECWQFEVVQGEI